ncbi:hypothetical protein EOD42_21160 [Rhodovarius crocodyli]|uniref:Peroxidase n=1 Tax=Rhodovarius crocodyli TaxID=1979269 RepID=A0A437M2P3_9PROT|nr:hypothetical protein [Rhodovarius crocodyli]RVT91825.1 hypothetical protein EOD42_21160 [Rhodovarius crocodyli]
MQGLHGGAPPAGGATPGRLDRMPPGYRHILPHGPNLAQERHPSDRLARLATRISVERQRENPDIPAGYTYFLQFVTHDCVFTDIPFWAAEAAGEPPGNERLRALNLDTLHGGGPTSCPHAYVPARDRALMRLGCPAATAARDVPRISPESGGPLTDTLLADPRNDDNALLGQMTVLFHIAHNVVVGLEGGLFAPARARLRALYRRLIREDLMPRILAPEILAYYQGGGATLNEAHSEEVPIEASHGVFRVAHAMVRETYNVNEPAPAEGLPLAESLRHSAARYPKLLPMPATWIARWSNFFDGLGRPAQRAMRFAPCYAPPLQTASFFPAVDATGRAGLHYRDMLSAEAGSLWSLEDLIEDMVGHHFGKDDPRSKALNAGPLGTPDARRKAMLDWLLNDGRPGALDSEDAARIAADPPMPFWLMLEGLVAGGGTRLGPLGSIILAETFYPNLNDAQAADEAALAGSPLGAIHDMAGLIQFLAAQPGLQGATPPFI